jgi:hypothetical protein
VCRRARRRRSYEAFGATHCSRMCVYVFMCLQTNNQNLPRETSLSSSWLFEISANTLRRALSDVGKTQALISHVPQFSWHVQSTMELLDSGEGRHASKFFGFNHYVDEGRVSFLCYTISYHITQALNPTPEAPLACLLALASYLLSYILCNDTSYVEEEGWKRKQKP